MTIWGVTEYPPNLFLCFPPETSSFAGRGALGGASREGQKMGAEATGAV